MTADVSRETPSTPEVARRVFSRALPQAEAYARLLAVEGALRGLIGPREVPRLWERHLLNCAVVTDVVPHGARVCDLGSGAGLPGLVMAIRRPDLRVTLLEPLLRRTTFLLEALDVLELGNVVVHRARAEQVHPGRGLDPTSAFASELGDGFDVVTSRAVAPMERLAAWSLPLTRVGGSFLAMKGSTAAEEVATALSALHALGGGEPSIVQAGVGVVDPSVTLVQVVKSRAGAAGTRKQRGSTDASRRS